jgi:hypothetical protein
LGHGPFFPAALSGTLSVEWQTGQAKRIMGNTPGAGHSLTPILGYETSEVKRNPVPRGQVSLSLRFPSLGWLVVSVGLFDRRG